MSCSLMLWRAEGPVDLEAALDAYRRFSRQESSRPKPGTKGIVGDFLQKLDQVFPERGGEDSPWAKIPHSFGDSFVMLEITPSRLCKVMNFAIPLAQQAEMTSFVAGTEQLYLPSDFYTPQLSLPSDAEIEAIVGKLTTSLPSLPSHSEFDAMIGELTGAAKLLEAVQVAIGRGLGETGFERVNPQVYARTTKICTHLVNPISMQFLDGTVVLRVSVGIRFEKAERIRAAADIPEMDWKSKRTHPTVGFSLEQLASELPTQWRIRSIEEARLTAARVVESIREHAEPYFRKYSDPDVLLEALVNNEEEAAGLRITPTRGR